MRGVDKAALAVSALTAGLFGSCNFDSAFDRYCANNPRCADAAAAADVGPDAGRDLAPDLGPDGRPDLGPDLPPWPDRDGPLAPPTSFVQLSSCMSDNECARNEICHPLGKVCMVTCRNSGECPPWLKTCRDLPVTGGGRTPKMVCTCNGNAMCADNVSSSYMCNPIDNLCEPSCSTSFDCAIFRLPRLCSTDLVCVPSCSSAAGCPSATQPHCDPARGCVGCVDDSDCAGRSDGLSQCNQTGSCMAPMSSP
jgi:hypothetical protein